MAQVLKSYSTITQVLRNYLGSKPTPVPTSPEKRTVRALPASWYASTDIYELEKRAIFSKQWLLTTHKARFPYVGDWLDYEVANFHFVIFKDGQGNIKAFLQDSDNKRDDWSSDKLQKAHPQRPIHIKVDVRGFIWTNLDQSETPIKWEDEFDAIDEHERFSYYDFDNYEFDHVWEMEGPYNWKILADNYNECYHCRVAHPDIPTIADLNSYWVETQKSYIQHFGAQRQDQIDRGFRIAVTYYLPNASTNISPHFFMIQRFVPHSPTRSTMRYEFYRNKDSTDEEFTVISELYKRVMSEDKYLCANAQNNVNAGIFVNGEMHPEMEQGPIFFQQSVRKLLREHHDKEQAAKRKL